MLPRIGRRPPSPEDAAPLKGQLWTRSERNLTEPDVHPLRRVIAATAAVAECALLGWLWFGPAMAVKSVDISGAHHLTPAQVAATAGVNGNGHYKRYALTPSGISARLLHSLETNAPPKNRAEEAAKAKARSAVRFGAAGRS